MKTITINVSASFDGERLDRFLASCVEDYSRTFLQGLIAQGMVLLNGRKSVPKARVRTGDIVTLEIAEPEKMEVLPEDIPISIVYEDEHLVVVDKPAGMVVHPAPGARSGTLVNALLGRSKDLSGIGGVLRPGIVHRLDKNTSGIMVVAKSDKAHKFLSEQVSRRTAVRKYMAVVWGDPGEKGEIDAPVGRSKKDRKKMMVTPDGRQARTLFSLREKYAFSSLLDVTLLTGRTHQIRVHLSFKGHPVFGDPDYGGRRVMLAGIDPRHRASAKEALKLIDRQALHAHQLSFTHPVSGEPIALETPPPPDFRELLDFLREDAGRV